MKKSGRLQYFISLSLFLLLVVLAPSAFAIGKPDTIGRAGDADGNPTGVQQERRQQVQNRLTEAKLKACQVRENIIKKRAERLGKLAKTIEEKFDAIAKRVEDYYVSKVVPSGKTVANYDSLIADIQTKKGAVQTALTQAQTNAASFSCTSDDPKGQMARFKDDMQAVKSALKDYRTSINDLIVAVRSVTGETERNKATSPKPTNTGGNE